MEPVKLLGPFGPYIPLRDDFDKQWRLYSNKILGEDDFIQNLHFPNFISIGGQRSGTTWLHEILSNHPSVFALERKEARYFTVDWITKNICSYSLLFKNDNAFISGETTPGYALLPRHAIETIYKINSEVKILYAIRNPVEHAWSLTKHMLNYRAFEFTNVEHEGGELSLEMFIKQFLLDYTMASSDHEFVLKRWLSVFPRENIFIYFFDDIKSKPENLIQRIQEFLGIDQYFSLPEFGIHNPIKQGLSGNIPEVLSLFLRTLWRCRLFELADYLNNSLKIAVPNFWEPEFVGPVIFDDIKIHNNPNGIDYFLKGGVDGGWFFAKSKSDSPSNCGNSVEPYRYLFDLHYAVTVEKKLKVEPEQLANLRQERIVSHMNAELFLKSYPVHD